MVWLIYHNCKPIRAPVLHIPMIQFLIKVISIYTPSALGDSSNLIGARIFDYDVIFTALGSEAKQNQCCKLGILPKFQCQNFFENTRMS